MAAYIDGLPRDGLILIHGKCRRGADAICKRLAEGRGIHCAEVPALWPSYGAGAGHKRNAAMLLLGPHHVVAFTLGTPGTQGMIGLAREAGLPVVVFGHEAVAA